MELEDSEKKQIASSYPESTDGAQYSGEEGGFTIMGDFSEKSIRQGFVKKVYAILCGQLAITICVMSIFMFVHPVKEYAEKNVWVFWVSFVAVMVFIIAMACCTEVRRSFPTNLIVLGIFTVLEGVLLGIVSSTYSTKSVMIAAGITAIVVLALTVFAFQTKIDFTMLSGILFVLLMILLLFGIFALIFQNEVLSIVYAALGAGIFSVYLVVDTQLMLGGRHKYALSPEEYIFASLNLYLDIINLFMMILMLTGGRQ